MSTDAPLSVCHVVSYRDPAYVRTRTFKAALASIENCRVFDATNRKRGFLRYLETLKKVMVIRWRHNPQVYLLGFRGHELFWPIRLLTIGKVLIFDEFMSPSDALISEKKAGFVGQVIGILAYPFEWLCLRFSKRVLTDTESHKRFIANRFGIAIQRIDVVYVGAIPANDSPIESEPSSPLSVLFYGTFLPLHGIDILLRACKLLEEYDIEFRIIGGQGKSLQRFEKLKGDLQLHNVRHDRWVDFDKLQSVEIPNADLCLGGPFGGTSQARRVITGKSFQFLSQGKPTVIGRIDDDAGFRDKENCFLVEQSNPESLAQAILWALDNRARLPGIGENGRCLFNERFSPAALGEQLERALRATL